MKRVFVSGATGYLGRYVCAEYQRRGWYVIAQTVTTRTRLKRTIQHPHDLRYT